jgi:hypothetical protein
MLTRTWCTVKRYVANIADTFMVAGDGLLVHLASLIYLFLRVSHSRRR